MFSDHALRKSRDDVQPTWRCRRHAHVGAPAVRRGATVRGTSSCLVPRPCASALAEQCVEKRAGLLREGVERTQKPFSFDPAGAPAATVPLDIQHPRRSWQRQLELERGALLGTDQRAHEDASALIRLVVVCNGEGSPPENRTGTTSGMVEGMRDAVRVTRGSPRAAPSAEVGGTPESHRCRTPEEAARRRARANVGSISASGANRAHIFPLRAEDHRAAAARAGKAARAAPGGAGRGAWARRETAPLRPWRRPPTALRRARRPAAATGRCLARPQPAAPCARPAPPGQKAPVEPAATSRGAPAGSSETQVPVPEPREQGGE